MYGEIAGRWQMLPPPEGSGDQINGGCTEQMTDDAESRGPGVHCYRHSPDRVSLQEPFREPLAFSCNAVR